jgi:hypothetical protein
MKYRKAVPRGSATKETWQMLMDDVDEFPDLMLHLWNKFHEHGILPRQWQVAEGAQIGKQNGKQGCAAVRLINILDPAGKIFFKELWAAASPPRLNFAYGFYKGRRREQAILVLHTTRWKLRQMGLGHTTTFHDVANAFPSTAYRALGKMVDECAHPGDRSLLKCRYGHTNVIIRGHGDKELVIRPRCGGLQGDACMAPMFSATYDTGMKAWEEQCRHNVQDGLWACDPISGEPTQVGKTLYADDAQETNVTEGVEELNEVLQVSNWYLNHELADKGLGRNDDKE